MGSAAQLLMRKFMPTTLISGLAVNLEAAIQNLQSAEEIRWKVVKAMFDDFPSLRRKVKSYVDKKEN